MNAGAVAMERIVLRDGVSLDDVDDARLARGWRVANLVTARPGVPAQQLLLTRDRRHLMHVVDDAQLGVRYLVVSGPEPSVVRREIEAALPTVDEESLRGALAAGEPRALGLAALMCTAARPDVLQAFDRAFVDRVEAVRVAALVAAAYARWPELEPRIARVAQTDPSASLRERALLILDAWPT